MPEDITNRLIHARAIVINIMGSNQADAEFAARYAVRHTDLPIEFVEQLTQYAKEGLTNRPA